ncbi:hypothetical protein GQ602_007229 [Ophiocordyceps camponoti-floridani]|uniref:Uncharacterized protein n=1 Tax=Ophiocordyceps camponoti-floridani TaxID=2030778 RepID=A0A8H4Q105_9HYPO|nr:hypothetical protein GQ602_007229 [Ophiocordyceps camponoti-floridani]
MKVLPSLLHVAAVVSLASATPTEVKPCLPRQQSENSIYMQFMFQKYKKNCTEGQSEDCNYVKVTRYWDQFWNPLEEELNDGGWGTGYWQIDALTDGRESTMYTERPSGWDPKEMVPKGDWGRVLTLFPFKTYDLRDKSSWKNGLISVRNVFHLKQPDSKAVKYAFPPWGGPGPTCSGVGIVTAWKLLRRVHLE